jgi:hypothetical protein
MAEQCYVVCHSCSVTNNTRHAECCYAERRYADSRYAERRYAERHYAESRRASLLVSSQR